MRKVSVWVVVDKCVPLHDSRSGNFFFFSPEIFSTDLLYDATREIRRHLIMVIIGFKNNII